MKSTARVSLRKYFIPGCVGRGLDLDLRVRPAAASGNLGICPLGIEVEKQGFRTAWLITGQKFQGVGLKLTAFILTFRDPSSHLCQKFMRMAESGDLDFGSCSIFQTQCFCGNLEHQAGGHFQNPICLREFENGTRTFPQIFFFNFHFPAIQKMLILS